MYLSRIIIKNFRGIKEMTVNFNKNLNVIIGANGQMKTALIDAIRLFYSWHEPVRDIEITAEDFYVEITKHSNGIYSISPSTFFEIDYVFEGLSDNQRGAFYQYLEKRDDGSFVASVHLKYEIKDKGRIISSFSAGKKGNGVKADWETMMYFHPYYLEALRDSTRTLMSTRNNLLGRVIARKIYNKGTEDDVKSIISAANANLLNRNEVSETKAGINDNLNKINVKNMKNVGLHIEQSRVEYIVNVIKPYLPFSMSETEEGFTLFQNSLGLNNLIYIASVLSDIKDCHQDDDVSIYALLIEEPEAHLHPQLQVNLYNFLKDADDNVNSQTFITTHSPTLTSKIPVENLILLHNQKAYNIGRCFEGRHLENIVRDTVRNKNLDKDQVNDYKKMLARYFDVTRSQLLFSSGCLFIEGVSECQLMETFSRIIGKSLLDNEIEIVDTDGTAFYQFLMLFNSSDESKRLPLKAAFVTDEDQFTESKDKDYDLAKLVLNNYQNLMKLREGIENGKVNNRVANMKAMSNNQPNIMISSGKKTLEYQICKANVLSNKIDTQATWLYEWIKKNRTDEMKIVESYIESISHEELTDVEQKNIALLLWKSLPGKAGFAQNLNNFLINKLESDANVKFHVPEYLCNAINHLL